jgi:two-component system OmpR family sensor kinase
VRHTLRLRLTLACLGLLAIGLVSVGTVTYRLVESFLVQRIDQQLSDRATSAQRYFAFGRCQIGGGGPRPDFLPTGGSPGFLRSSLVFGIVNASGKVTLTTNGETFAHLPAGLPGSTKSTGASDQRSFDTSLGSASFRALAVSVPHCTGTIVFALPLHDANSTLDEILIAELIVGGVALVAVGTATWWLVRRGLRPLERMSETATAIAGGDLSLRVDEEDGTSEVGQLGVAFNGMLTQIEGEIAERRGSEERLRRFAADASHELRTPLTSIRGYAELFRRGAADRPEDLALTMRRIESEATRMTSLVDDLLLLARLDRKRPLAHEPVDVARLAADVVESQRIVHPQRSYRLSLDALTVVGDEARLRQVLLNLLSNAASHTPEGTPIDLSTRGEHGEVLIEVADHGPGLTPEDAARVFERFFRVDASRGRSDGGGSGLGLAIVAAIVEAHGGRVEVESVPGEGARFRVRLPAATGAPVAEPDPVSV